jgi:hypothetical protein
MRYVRCTNNEGYKASLTAGAIYKLAPNDGDAASLRVIDNEGEDYLYDARRFEPVEVNSLGAIDDTVTIHINSTIKAILRAEALAERKAVSALLREWVEERLDLPVS